MDYKPLPQIPPQKVATTAINEEESSQELMRRFRKMALQSKMKQDSGFLDDEIDQFQLKQHEFESKSTSLNSQRYELSNGSGYGESSSAAMLRPPTFNASVSTSNSPALSPKPVAQKQQQQQPPHQESRSRQDDRRRKHEIQIARASADPETVRKCLIADYYFLDHYHDFLTYMYHRKERLTALKEEMRFEGLSQAEQQHRLRQHYAKETAYLRKRRCRTNAAHFNILTQIGQGGYGQVFLARKKDTGEICALKKMSKKLLHKMNEIQHVITERDVLTQTRTPWLVKLLYAFQDHADVYLAMEYVPGGDMRTLLNNSGILRECDAQFYTAEMFLAINELHRLGVIHRDLKPENFLIDTSGHLKLTDFGLSKGQISQAKIESLRNKLEALKDSRLIHYSSLEKRTFYQKLRMHNQDHTRAFSLVGSPDYMAPEILMQSHHAARSSAYAEGYDYLVDYWSLGCILFEFLAGYPPFSGQSPEDVWVNVYHWQEVLERPQYDGVDAEFNLSNDSWDLINHLIAHRHRRYSNLKQVQTHPWFSQMNERLQRYQMSIRRAIQRPNNPSSPVDIWTHLRTLPRGFVDPPFIPELTNELDHRHFDDFSNPESMDVYKEVYDKMDRLNNSELDQVVSCFGESKTRSSFVGFTFRHKDAVDWRHVDSDLSVASAEGLLSLHCDEPRQGVLKRLQMRFHRDNNN